MNDTEERAMHHRTWEAIPWLVNGRITDAERGVFEEHLRACRDCREELAFQRRVCDGILHEAEPAVDPDRALERLWQRIDAETVMAAPTGVAKQGIWVKWLATAAVLEAVALSALIGAGLQQAAPQYRTLSAAASDPAPSAIRAVFDPQLPLAELQKLLDRAGLQVVGGPSEVGVYTLAPRARARRDTALALLKADQRVRFAEPTDAVPR